MSQTTYGACADCGNDARACGRGLCVRCYSKHQHAGTLDAYQLHMLQAAFPDVWDEVQARYNALTEPTTCAHDVVEFDPGNRVPPYGWEQYPGWYCTTCGEQIDEGERR